MDEFLSSVKDHKISVGVVLMVIAAMLWADEKYVTSEDLHELTALIQQHIKEYRINEAIADVESVESDLAHLSMHEQLFEETPETNALKRELQERKKHAEEYRSCVINDRPNCDHLKRR